MEQLIKSIRLDNGLDLKIYDASKSIAADRWQVNLVARIIIPVDETYSENTAAQPAAAEIRQALGDTVTYEITKQRNFIDESEKQPVLNQLFDMFIQYSAPYLSHPDFGKRFILKQYQKHKVHIPR